MGPFREALEERLRHFGLSLHDEKTRILRFGRYARKQRAAAGEGRPEVFDFLGFTHICGVGRGGCFFINRWTSMKRMRATLHAVRAALMRRRHLSLQEQGRWLAQVIRGYFAYFAVPTNMDRLAAFRHHLVRAWYHALRRRSQRDRTRWDRLARLAERWLPRPQPSHPWPEARFYARTQGKSRVR